MSSIQSEKIKTVKVHHPAKDGQTMYVNSDHPGLKDGTLKVVEESDEDVAVYDDDEDEDE